MENTPARLRLWFVDNLKVVLTVLVVVLTVLVVVHHVAVIYSGLPDWYSNEPSTGGVAVGLTVSS